MRKTFRELLEADEPIIGAFLQTYSPESVEILAKAGYNYLTFDNEHGQFTDDQLVSLVRTADSAGLATQIRIPALREELVKHALDLGAGSVMVPNINSADDAKKLVEYAKYPPDGNRGACPYVRANSWGIDNTENNYASYYVKKNKETVLSVLVESPNGVEELEDIIKVDGIDIIGIGTVDLSVALGVPGQYNHSVITGAINRLHELCHKYGKFCGNHADNAKEYLNNSSLKIFFAPPPPLQLYDAAKNYCNTIKEQLL